MVVAKANKMLGFLRKNWAGLVNRVALLWLCHSLVRSHVCFYSQIWAFQSAVNNLFLVESIQWRASHFIVGKGGGHGDLRCCDVDVLLLRRCGE